jgi:hypothetical protein
MSISAPVRSADGGTLAYVATRYAVTIPGGKYTLGYTLSAYDARNGALIRALHTWHGLGFQTGTEVAVVGLAW